MKRTYSDKEIVSAIQAGNADKELQFLYDTTQVKIRGYVLQNNGSLQEAQDIFQDAVVAFFKQVLAGKFDQSKSVDGFIYTIGRNLWINRAKRMSRMVANPEQLSNRQEHAESNSYLHRQISAERAEKMDALLSRLGNRCKELLTHTIFYRMRMDEVAQRMGFSGANAAKTQNYKCKQKLIRLLNENKHLREHLYP